MAIFGPGNAILPTGNALMSALALTRSRMTYTVKYIKNVVGVPYERKDGYLY